jgi:hypothetical protein
MLSRIAPAVLAALGLTASIAQAQTCPPTAPPLAVAGPAACACTGDFVACNDLPAGANDSNSINRCLQEPTCKCAQLQAATYNLQKPILVKSMRGATPPVVLDGARLIGKGAKTILRAVGNGDQCSFPVDANDKDKVTYAPVIEVNRSANVALHGFTIDVSDLRQVCASVTRKGGFTIRYVTAVSGAHVTNVNIVGEPFVSTATYKTGGALSGGIQVYGADSVVQGNLIKDVGFIQVGGSSGVSAIQLINAANSTIASNQVVHVAFGIEVVNGIADSNAGDGSGTKVIGNTICGAAGIKDCPLCSGGRAIKLEACRVGDDRNEMTSPIPPPLRDLQVNNNYAAQFGGGRKSNSGDLAPGGSGLDLICGIQFGHFTGNTIDGRGFNAEFGLQLRSACESDSCAAPLTLHYEPKSTTHHNTFQSNTFYSGSGGTNCSSCVDVNINAEAPDQINVGRSLGSGTGANTFRGSPRHDGGFNGCPGSLYSQTTFAPASGIATTKLQLATRGVRPNSQVTVHFMKDGVDKPFTFSNVACTTMIGKKIRRLGLAEGTYTVTADYQDGNAGSRDPSNPMSTTTTNPVTILGDRLGTLTVTPSAPVPPPVGNLLVSPTSLSFSGVQGGPSPALQRLSIQSDGAALDWSAYEGVPWLSIAPTAGTTPGLASVTVNLAGLTAGTYTTQILVSSSDSSDITIPVTLTVGPPGTGTPNLAVSPASLSFQATAGGANPPVQSLSIGSTGSALSWSVSDNATWLVLSPISGVTPGSTGASVNIAGLPAGTYSATVTVSAAGAGNSPVNVPVTLTVSPGTTNPTLIVSPSSLSFSGANPAPAALSLSSTGSALGFSVADNVAWLSESPISGSTPSSVSVFVNTAGLPPGTYNGTITISAPGATNPQVFVPVSLTIPQAGCSLLTSPASLAFTAPQGGPNATAQLLTIGSSGAATPFTVSSNAAFLSASPVSGTTPGTVTVFTNVGVMGAGTYNGALLISCPSGGSVTVPVSLTVTAAPPPSAPFVNGFSPASGSAGSQVSVSGGNFVGVTSVTIAGQPAGFSVSTSNSLLATVPGGTPGCGRILVSNSAGTGQSPDIFAITPGAGPVICNFNPLSGRAGDSITLRGGNFVNVQSVTINGVPASFFTAGSAFLGVTVPSGATTGLIQVVTASGSASSPTSFTVTP